MAGDISVLHIITKLAVGGAGMNTLISCREINDRGFRSEILTGPERPSEGDYFHLAEEFGVRTTIVPSLVRRISPLKDLRAVFQIRRVIDSGDYTIVHTHGSKARLLGRLAARLSSNPPRVVQTFHGWPFDFRMSLPVQAGCIFLERLGFRLAQASVAVTPEDIFKGVVWGVGKPHNYTLIRSGVEFHRFRAFRGRRREAREKLGIGLDRPVVGSVIRLAPVKDPGTLLDVAERVVSMLPDCLFVIVGDGPMKPWTQGEVERRKLSGSVMLCGNRDDVEELLPAFDAFLISSRSEGLPRVLLEALSSGVPAVSTDVGGVFELLKGDRNGFTSPVGDPDSLSEHLLRLLRNPELGGELLRDVDNDLRPFSAEKMVEDLKKLYLWVTEGPEHRPRDAAD